VTASAPAPATADPPRTIPVAMGERHRGESDGPAAPTLLQRLEYLGLRAFAFALLCTDLRGAARMGSAASRAVGLLDPRHREIGFRNLRRAYGPALPDAEARRIVWKVYEGLGVTAAEWVHGPRRLRGRARARWIEVEGAEAVRRAAKGGPVVFLSAHLGNWEHGIAAARQAGFDVIAIARPLDSPLLAGWIDRQRARTGTPTVQKYGALRGLIRAVRAGRSIAMLMDQNAGKRGRLVPFFGRPVSTIPSGVALAKRLRLPVVVATMERRAPGFHRLRFGPPMYVEDGAGGEDRMLETVNRVLEARVRERPGDWLWLHRRWRVKADWGLGGPVSGEGDA